MERTESKSRPWPRPPRHGRPASEGRESGQAAQAHHGIQQTINENTQNIENNTNAITQNTQDIQNSVTSISNLITSFNGMQTDVSNSQDQVLVLYDKLNKTFPVCRTIEVRQTD